MPTDTTLKGALRQFGLNVSTHIGAPWTYALPNGEICHLCWREGRSITWPKSAQGAVTYRDTFDDFDPGRPGVNAMDSFRLLAEAQAEKKVVRCIIVSGSKSDGTRYMARPDWSGRVMLAVAEPGVGIEVFFR